MISATNDRRRRALLWSALVSAALHLMLLTLIFAGYSRLLTARGKPEVVTQAEIVTIHKAKAPRPAHPHRVRAVHPTESAPAKVPPHELARIVRSPAPPEPPRVPSVESKIERDTAGFAREVARLNRENDPHALPTIDPASTESATKSYSFAAAVTSGNEHGNGIITPVQSWHASGRDCYYGRYEYTYPDGAMESGSIVWPFCYDPESDPFKEPPHPIPFPLPLPGYHLSSDAELPPIEKTVYEHWAAGATGGSAP